MDIIFVQILEGIRSKKRANINYKIVLIIYLTLCVFNTYIVEIGEDISNHTLVMSVENVHPLFTRFSGTIVF